MHMPYPKQNHSRTVILYKDTLILNFLQAWRATQLALGIELRARVFAWLIHGTCTQFTQFPNLAPHPSTIRNRGWWWHLEVSLELFGMHCEWFVPGWRDDMGWLRVSSRGEEVLQKHDRFCRYDIMTQFGAWGRFARLRKSFPSVFFSSKSSCFVFFFFRGGRVSYQYGDGKHTPFWWAIWRGIGTCGTIESLYHL